MTSSAVHVATQRCRPTQDVPWIDTVACRHISFTNSLQQELLLFGEFSWRILAHRKEANR